MIMPEFGLYNFVGLFSITPFLVVSVCKVCWLNTYKQFDVFDV